jgi:hypothetical protein
LSGSLLWAWLLPVATGVACFCAADARKGPGRAAAAAGYGTIIGLFLAGAATALFSRSDTMHSLTHAGPWMTALLLIAGTAAWWRSRGAVFATQSPARVEKWTIALVAMGFASLVFRAWLAIREILLRPTYPWDAWDAWAVKSKTWFLLGHYVPFVSMRDWLAQFPPVAFTGPAWSYPAALAWIQVWFAGAIGEWNEPLLNLPWLALWIGMLLAHYGQWRALGLSRGPAFVFVYILGSLPLLTVHVALAGYADLWIASLFGLAVLSWLRWIEQRNRGQLAIAVFCAACLPVVKLEGVIWLLLLASIALYTAIPKQRRRYVVGVILATLLMMIAVGKLALPIYGLGWVNVGTNSIDVPVLGQLPLGWHPAAAPGLLSSLFAQSNWHLLWWLTPVLVIWRWKDLRAHESSRHLALLLLAGFLFLGFLFLCTDAARWAESYTAVNRLLMHLVPATITLWMLLYRGARTTRRGRASEFFPRSDPE